MAICRQEYYNHNGRYGCAEADEWADYPYNQPVAIDCSLVSPTRASTPPPQWWVDYMLERYFLDLRQQENILNAEALNISIDDYLNENPERVVWFEYSQNLAKEYVINNQPAGILEFETFIKAYPFSYY
jgi:hypothetical protein